MMSGLVRRAFCGLLLTLVIIIGMGCSNFRDLQYEDIDDSEGRELIVVGFSQVGSESSWRVANSESMKRAFSEENGYELIFDDAKQKQENQYKAIRTFIQQKVDYIVLAPITETGWDDVLYEAKMAGIPVIVVDRQVSVDDNSLYISWVGSDFLQEGQTAVQWLEAELERRKSIEQSIEEEKNTEAVSEEKVKILHVQGTVGATSQLMRSMGLESALEVHTNWERVGMIQGEYTEAKAYEATKEFLQITHDFDVVYSENDNMTFGVMRALDEEGISYGRDGDVILISFDAVRSALMECLNGQINLCVECNPLHGPRAAKIIEQIENHIWPAKMNYVEETSFDETNISQELIDARSY